MLLLIPLILMIISDYRFRNVRLWHLLLFGTMQLSICFYEKGFEITGQNILINILIFLIISGFIALYAWFRFRTKKELIGWGDILFILCLTPAFSYRQFLFFMIISLSVILAVWLLWLYFKQRVDKIPLVSGLGVCYSVLLIYNTITQW